MFRRIRHKKWMVAGLGIAALVAPASAVAGNHNMSNQASNALVAKGQAMNQRYATVAQGKALNDRYSASKPLSYAAYQAILGKALNDRYSSLRYGAPDGWTPYAISLTEQSRPTIVDGRSPDTVDFATQAHSPVVTVTREPGFQWGDFGVGLAAAMAVIALLAISTRLFSGRGQRPVTTS